MSEPSFDREPSSHADTVLLPPVQKPLGVLPHGCTDQGRVRPANEDHFLVAEHAQALRVYGSSLPQPKTQFSSERSYLLLVADGMGGHEAGELASALAVETVAQYVLEKLREPGAERSNIAAELVKALNKADDRLFQEIGRNPHVHGMGTTLTLAYTLGNELFLAHVGDSRAYLLRDGQLRQLTDDHTMVREMVQKGILRPAEAATHSLRHMLTNVVGGPDVGVRVELHQMELEIGDVLLLCTDGLTDMLEDSQIREILSQTADPDVACQLLIEAANQAGGEDNITAVVAHIDRENGSGSFSEHAA